MRARKNFEYLDIELDQKDLDCLAAGHWITTTASKIEITIKRA